MFAFQETRSDNQAHGTRVKLASALQVKEGLLPVQRGGEPGLVCALAKPIPGFPTAAPRLCLMPQGELLSGDSHVVRGQQASLSHPGLSKLYGHGAETWKLLVH